MNANATLDFVGSVGVYSGADGAIIWSRNGAGFVDEFGWAVAAAGDVDGDGIADIIVGAPGAGGVAAVPGPGAAHVFSGIDGVSSAPSPVKRPATASGTPSMGGSTFPSRSMRSPAMAFSITSSAPPAATPAAPERGAPTPSTAPC